jgi:hypothetical protein
MAGTSQIKSAHDESGGILGQAISIEPYQQYTQWSGGGLSMPREFGLCIGITIAASFLILGSAACASDEGSGSIATSPGIAADTRGVAEAASSATHAGGERNVAGDFYEVLLNWGASGADPRVREWLEGRGLTAMSMKAGMLTLVSPGQIEKAFGVSVQGAQTPFELPVPEELRSAVTSVTVLKPRSYH